jgi:DNA helicase II / ATP-dependent DNA helicase PcrA
LAQTTEEFEKAAPAPVPADQDVPLEEEALLARALDRLAQKAGVVGHEHRRYDAELVALRDEIGEARLEDVPALIAQMERLQGVAARRAEAEGALVDPKSPYFGHLKLREQSEQPQGWSERDVMIGRATFVDAKAGVRIVDWRHAPVSQLYYRYAEGSPYEERFGDREVEGEILARRTVTIDQSTLIRVSAPQGTFVRAKGGHWRRFDARESALAGGQGTAARPGQPVKGVLGVGPDGQQRIDRHLPEIAALIDPRQFELITAPDAGLVVIQGGAGSGKTTIGLHRMAYLAYTNSIRFAPQKMRVVTYGAALAAYISQVLPALGVHGVQVITFPTWAEKELRHAIPWLAVATEDDAPSVVTRMKKHPALLHDLERRAEDHKGRRNSRAVVELWADVLTDLDRLKEILGKGPDAMRPDEIKRAHRHCADRCSAVLDSDQGPQGDPDEEPPDDADVRGATGIDGIRTEDERARLDLEDHPLLLRANQVLRGPLRGSKRSTLINHLFVDEAQDLSPLELAVLIAQTSPERSITLAGDTSQRLFLDNGFNDWRGVLEHLSLSHVEIEPLRIAYRSTKEILEVARYAMGPLADPDPPVVPRSGAPVEAHCFPGNGAAVAFLAEALRPLSAREPRATVAVLARYPEQADLYYEGLKRSEVPYLRRVRAQDFSFRPGIEVTDIRQVKGLEFDYVVMLDVNAATFAADDESRHLFHIAATRAAHQLWLVVTAATPSPLILPELLSET